MNVLAVKGILAGLAHLVAPRVCRVCGDSLTAHEDVLCLKCLLELPRTNIHADAFNAIHQRLGHSCRVDRAAGWFYYKRESPFAQMLIDSKYGNMPWLDRKLGRMCASELMHDRFFDGIDLIAPMPMHWFKRLKRGYNQAREIALGISEVTGIPVSDALEAAKSHGVQARHARNARFTSIAGTLRMARNADISGKHVLFVDDIITTGASAAEAVRTLQDASPSAVSVLALGLTALA